MNRLASITDKFTRYQAIALGSTPNTVAKKLHANNDLYSDVTNLLLTYRADSNAWMELHELQSIQDRLELDKRVGTDLLNAGAR